LKSLTLNNWNELSLSRLVTLLNPSINFGYGLDTLSGFYTDIWAFLRRVYGLVVNEALVYKNLPYAEKLFDFFIW
jgi:hypothetical protein